MASAKVQTLHRRADGKLTLLKLAFKSGAVPRLAHLSVAVGSGFRWIPSAQIAPVGIGFSATFEIPWDALPVDQILVAESVVLDTHRMLYLDRLIELNAQAATASPADNDNSLVAGQSGIWGWDNQNRPWFIESDDRAHEPITLMVKNSRNDFARLEADGFDAQVELAQTDHVVEVRLQYKRMAVVSTKVRTPEEIARGKSEPPFVDVDWNGEQVHLILGGHAVHKTDYFETVAATGKQITTHDSPRGRGREIRARMSIPFLAGGTLDNANLGHIPPLFTPILLEVVLASGQTLTHAFGKAQPEDCASLLEVMFKAGRG